MRPIREIVDDWAMPIKENGPNRWFPIEGRPEAIMRLMLLLKQEGYNRSEVESARKPVIDHCVNKKSKKVKSWTGMVVREFERAVWAVFGEKLGEVELVNTDEMVEAGKRMLEAAKEDAKERIAVEKEARAEVDAEALAARYRQYVPDPELLKTIESLFKFGPGGDDEEIL